MHCGASPLTAPMARATLCYTLETPLPGSKQSHFLCHFLATVFPALLKHVNDRTTRTAICENYSRFLLRISSLGAKFHNHIRSFCLSNLCIICHKLRLQACLPVIRFLHAAQHVNQACNKPFRQFCYILF